MSLRIRSLLLLLAGVLLGLALGTKEWTLLAIVPAPIACREGREVNKLTQLRPAAVSRPRRRAPLRVVGGPAPIVALCALVGAFVALSSSSTGDYAIHGPVGGDNPAPAIDALIHGDFGRFAATQPLMGLVSIVLRLPFAAIASVAGGGDRLAYRLGALACLVVPCGLAAWLMMARRSANDRLGAILAGVVVLASPAALAAIAAGHPEELLASVLATVAVLAAIGGRVGWAGVLLGLAVATKQWTLIAALPVLVALPRRKLRAAALAAGLALALTAPAPLADQAAFSRASRAVSATTTANPVSVWWPLGSLVAKPARATTAPSAHRLPDGLTRSTASLIVLGLAVAAIALALVRGRRWRRAPDALAVLALLGLARCVGDPGNLHYYYLAVLVPLAAWEIIGRERAPVVTVIAAAAASVTFGSVVNLDPAVASAALLTWTVALGGYVAASVFRAPRAPQAGAIRRPRAPQASASA